MIYCRIIGPVEVSIDGDIPPAPLLWRKHLGLLVYLACSPRRSRSRDHLVGLLWGDKAESSARHSLNEALRVLRRSCGDEAIDTTGDRVRLLDGTVRLDCDDFAACEAAADWKGAAELIIGDFLEGFVVPNAQDFDAWVDSQRLAWRRRMIDALCNCGAELLSTGDAAGAAHIGVRALDLDPLSQPACRLAVRALALAGERSAALERFEAFEARLADRLGTAPDDETRGLAELVRQGRTYGAAAGFDARDVRSRAGPLVGREAELGRIVHVWDGCRTGKRAALVVIQGDPGSGKTRLLEEVVNRARLDDAATYTIRAVEADAGAPDFGVHTLLREMRALDNKDEANALAAALAEAMSDRPALIAIDAAHWLDRSSLLALQPLLRDLADAPFMLVLTIVRHPLRMEIETLRSRIGRELDGTVVSLKPLNHEALRSLVASALPEWSRDQIDRVTRRVAVDSAGLPLLAVELLHAIRHGLDLGTFGSAWPQPLETLDQTMPGQLPDAMTAAVRVGFRKLSEGARDVLVAMALLSERTSTDVLARATERSEREVVDALDELEWHRWITSEPRGYAFTARIVREVVVREMVSTARRKQIQAMSPSETKA